MGAPLLVNRQMADSSFTAAKGAMLSGETLASGPPSWLRRLLQPSLADVVFVVIMAILFMTGAGWSELLSDGESGTHIKTGEYILATRGVPTHDLYSFTSPGRAWYAWEWLSDILFAGLHHFAGLKGVVLFCGAVICFAITLLFRQMVARGVDIHIAAVMTIIAAGAMNFHYLARPHVFSMLFSVVAFWALDRDWSHPSTRTWLLVPLACLWANMHGGFLVLLVALGCYTISAGVARDHRRAWRFGTLAVACLAATLVNPYGWQLHLHIWHYLRADWLITYIDEFQSPVFRTPAMLRFEMLLFGGLICLWPLARRRRWHQVMIVAFWAHAGLVSARHVTVYVIAAVPPIAVELNTLWAAWTRSRSRRSVIGILRDLFRELRPAALSTSAWLPLFLALLALTRFGGPWPTDFPASFPTALLTRNADVIGTDRSRIITVDLWGGYLNYKYYPHRRVFLDGRSDYYDRTVLDDFLALRAAGENWRDLLAKYDFAFALIPPDWPLARALKESPEWVLRDQDKTALLFERRGARTLAAR
jgi:hypothetical protein